MEFYVWALPGPIICFVLWLAFLLWDKAQTKEQTLIGQGYVKPFSSTEYLGRTGKESLELAGRKEQYPIVLWWGYDGLRLNEDGTTEWISRKPAPPPQIDYSVCNVSVTQSGLQKRNMQHREHDASTNAIAGGAVTSHTNRSNLKYD